ncbi:transmembrane protease serine 9 [Drosophila busckii]|uniref:transmembrane protease serine 9 n=1 Tax=Drosophila busckii TaxID=30019 RepID=UPI00083EC08A|nr:transmembrane protease serine 9 [Drosophila busckii]
MKQLRIIILSLLLICQRTLGQDYGFLRIINGTAAKAKQLPYQVALHSYFSSAPKEATICGGTIISKRWILTAAHCLQEPNSKLLKSIVLLGVFNKAKKHEAGIIRMQINSSHVIPHEHYDLRTVANDIGLVRLPQELKFNVYAQPAKLPKKNDKQTFEGRLAIASGWGVTAKQHQVDVLQYITVKIISNKQCEQLWNAKLGKARKLMLDSFICIDPHKGLPCRGDSGGPLVLNDGSLTLVGIISHGFDAKCQLRVPDIFTRVSSHIDWILRHTGKFRAGAMKKLCTLVLALLSIAPSQMLEVNVSYQAVIQTFYTEFEDISTMCSGALISSRWILTAAHCFEASDLTLEYILVAMGISDKNFGHIDVTLHSRDIIVHEEYDPRYGENDIALLNLPANLNLNLIMQSVQLPSVKTDSLAGRNAIISGWGLLKRQRPNRKLGFYPVKILSNEKCQQEWKSFLPGKSKEIVETFLCIVTGKYTRFNGDSGGPLVLDTYPLTLVGIVSHGYYMENEERPPDICTRVSDFLSWIYKFTGNLTMDQVKPQIQNYSEATQGNENNEKQTSSENYKSRDPDGLLN